MEKKIILAVNEEDWERIVEEIPEDDVEVLESVHHYTEALEGLEAVLAVTKLPLEMMDWTMQEWTQFALDFLTVNLSSALEGLDNEGDETTIPKYFEEGSPLWSMFFEASKMDGTFRGGLSFIEESLTFAQYTELDNFITWLEKNPEKTLGHVTYHKVYLEFKSEATE